MADFEVNGDISVADVKFNGDDVDFIYYKDSTSSTKVWERPIVPTIPDVFNATDTLEDDNYYGQVQCTWNASTGGTPPIYYDLYKSTTKIATNVTSGYKYKNSTRGDCETGTYHVKARNAYGTSGASNANAGYGWVQHSSPSSLSWDNSVAGQLTVSFTDPIYGCPAYSTVKLFRNGSLYKTETTSSSPVTFTGMTAGTYHFFIKCCHSYKEGNQSLGSSITIT